MYNKIIILTALLSIVKSHDVIVGLNTEGRKIFDEKREANPAIWRQVQNVTVNTTDNEVISRIVVTDLRPEKDGDVNIIDGGEGQKSVTLELKSPTVLRGYEFHIEVYAVPDKNQQAGSQKNVPETPTPPSQVRKQRNPEEPPKTDLSSINPPQRNTDAKTTSPEHIDNEQQKIPTPVSVLGDPKVIDNSRRTRQTDIQAQFNPPPPPHYHSQEIPQGTNIPKIPLNGNPVPPPIPSNQRNIDTTNSTVSTSNQQSKYTRDTKNQEEEKNAQPHVLTNNKDQNEPIVPATLYNDQTRKLRDVQNENKNDQTKPVQPVLPENIPKISIADNAPEIVHPNGENKERTNGAISTFNQQSKHTRDTKEQEKDEHDTQPRTVANKDEKAPIVPSDINKEQTRKVRDVESQEKPEDKFKPVVPPVSFAKNFDSSTNIPINSNEKRTSRATEKEEKSIGNINPGLQNNRRPFIPAHIAKSIENTTLAEDKRIARDTHNEEHDDTYKSGPHITGPIVPANLAKNVDNATHDAPNNEKRISRATEKEEKSNENINPSLQNNRSPIAPANVAKSIKNTTTAPGEHERVARDTKNEKYDDAYKFRPHITEPPANLAKNVDNATHDAPNNEKRISRATEKEEKSNENLNPSLQNNRRPFVPANIAKSIENATTIAVEDKRITRDTQNEDDTYKSSSHTTGSNEPRVPINLTKNVDSTTHNAPNNEKRHARDTQYGNKSDINVNNEKTTDNKNPPLFAARNSGRFGEHSTHNPDQSQHKSNDDAHTSRIHVTNDRNSQSDAEKRRVTRDTQNAQTNVNKPKSTDNEKKPNPPTVASRNSEKVQPPRRRPTQRDTKKVSRVPNTAQTNKNSPSTPKSSTNAPRNVRSAQYGVPDSPKNDNGKTFQFQIQGTHSLSSIFPTTEKTTTSATTTAATKKNKRETDLSESHERNYNITKTPRLSAQNQSPISSTSKPFDQKPVISIQ